MKDGGPQRVRGTVWARRPQSRLTMMAEQGWHSKDCEQGTAKELQTRHSKRIANNFAGTRHKHGEDAGQ